MKLPILPFVVAAMLAAPAAAVTTITVDSTQSTGTALFLDAGTYTATLTGGGWNAWGNVTGCDAEGAHCENGWLGSFAVAVPGKPWAINDQDFPLADRFANAELAFAAYRAYGPVTFSLDTADTVSFIAADGNFAGNLGSFTLDIAPVPEPGEWAMMGLGLLITGGVARRAKQKG